MRKKLAILLVGVMVAAVPTGAMAASSDLMLLDESSDGVEIDKTNFPNDVFREYVEKHYDKDGNGILSESESAAVTELRLDNDGMKSLEGIEFFPNLKKLYCSNNGLSSLDVSQNTELTLLFCEDNKIRKLDVSNNPALTDLDCNSNNLSKLDVSKNSNLQNLYCYHNELGTLDVSNNPKLSTLFCQDTDLYELDLSENPSLMSLTCADNHLVKLDLSNIANTVTMLRVAGQTRDVTAMQTDDILWISLRDLVGAGNVANVSLEEQDGVSLVGNKILIEDPLTTEVAYTYETGRSETGRSNPSADSVMEVTLTITQIVEAEAADKADLENGINEVETLTESDFTAESWEALQTALAAAQAVDADAYATQDEVDEALLELETAKNNLEKADEPGDSGNPDTGNPDTGNPDTGNPDTGNPDTGNPDTGNPDTGNPDTGNPDTGNPDTGNPDTGSPDTGNPDTGNPDSGSGVKTVEKIDGTWTYTVDGKADYSYTGFASNSNGKWYVEKGIVTFNKKDIAKDSDGAIGSAGTWYYVVGSKVQTGYTDRVSEFSNASGWWYIKNGQVDFSANTVAKNNNGWWYVTGGKVQFGYTGVANYKNANGWWYIKSGKVDFSANTVAKNNNGWWYVTGGKVQFGYTGVTNYKNANGWWYVKGGKVDFSFTGVAPNKNGTWYVKGGKVQLGFNGAVTYQGKAYTIRNGKTV